MADQLRMFDRTEVFGQSGHRIAQAFVVERVAADQLQLHVLIGSPERRAAPVQRILLLQAFADRIEDRVCRRAYGVRAYGWLRRGKGAPVTPP